MVETVFTWEDFSRSVSINKAYRRSSLIKYGKVFSRSVDSAGMGKHGFSKLGQLPDQMISVVRVEAGPEI